jgi:hypothetical protein
MRAGTYRPAAVETTSVELALCRRHFVAIALLEQIASTPALSGLAGGLCKREETMQKTLSYAALAAVLAVASPVLAQTPSSGASHEAASQAAPPSSVTQPPSSSGSPSQAPGTTAPSATTPSGTNAAANAGASADVASGMSVKDSTGAVIGQITAVKGDMATIKMGADTFNVDTAKLGVQGGAATINATQAELKKMLPKK